MHGKTLAIALPFPGLWNAGEVAALLARFLRAADRERGSAELVTLPWLDGASGTIDFLVTQSLGSFLEVEATGATGEDIIVPIGFAGEDGKLAVVEMARVSPVDQSGQRGSTAGIGELIQDALDEGAFSILLCHEEPLACDAGFGAAAALGVRFFDVHNSELLFVHSGGRREEFPPLLSEVARIDVSGRSFALLSSRIYIARSASAIQSSPSPELLVELERLAEIIQRDAAVPVSLKNLSASAVEFGLTALLGAEAKEGHALVLEASGIEDAIKRGEFSEVILLAPSYAEIENAIFGAECHPLRDFLDLVRTRIDRRAIVLGTPLPKAGETSLTNGQSLPEPLYSLADVPVFQAPLGANASMEERRRDFGMRLEKLIPNVLSSLREDSGVKEKLVKPRHS
jgi:glycerate 2-kinase